MKTKQINYETEGKYKDENSRKRGEMSGAGDHEKFVVESVPGNTVFDNRSDQWLTTNEAAAYLRISSKRLLNLTSSGKVRYYKLGRSNRFRLRDLAELLLAQPRGSSYGN